MWYWSCASHLDSCFALGFISFDAPLRPLAHCGSGTWSLSWQQKQGAAETMNTGCISSPSFLLNILADWGRLALIKKVRAVSPDMYG